MKAKNNSPQRRKPLTALEREAVRIRKLHKDAQREDGGYVARSTGKYKPRPVIWGN